MPDFDPEAPIFLIGFMASGKTTVGRLLAARLGWAFADLDDLIAAGAGRTVPQIFAAEGEAGFRRRETDAVREAAARRRAVIATGGGAACREENLAAMCLNGRVVALEVSAEESVRRAGPASGRPLFDGQADPVGAARALLAVRRSFYERAHLCVRTDGRRPKDVAAAIADGLAAAAARRSEA
jgi:shikimate kinase